VSPTAGGKSIIVAAIADKLSFPIIILQPNKELLIQNYNKYISFGNKASIFSASLKSKEIGHVTFATIGSIKTCYKQFKDLGVKLVVIDEAHTMSAPSGQLNTFLKELGVIKILGLTATPIVLNNTMEGPKLQMVNRTRKSFWNDILFITQIKDLIKLGYWCKLKYECIKLKDEDLEFNSSRSEYTEKSIEKVYVKNDIDQLVINKVEEIKNEKKHILIFCPSVAKAVDLQSRIESSVVIYGNLSSKDRDERIKAFVNGEVQIMINVLILSIGFDMPHLDCIIDTVPTASIARDYQKKGRIVRLDPNNSNKEGLIIDYAGNTERFGELEDLTFENCEGIGWGMFTKDTLLTGIRIAEIGTVKRPTLKDIEIYEENLNNPIITFGKHKDKKIKNIPKDYLSWIIENFTWNHYNTDLKNAITKYLNE
jgi:DNA repair protein RadD